jgi:raffinose/stachyose/melibiose transport system permease protein
VRQREHAFQLVLFFLLVLLALIFLLPFYFITINSVKSFSEIIKTPASLPTTIRFENYRIAIRQVSFFQMLFNSLVITVFSVSLMVLFGSPAAWKLVRVPSKVSTIFFTLYVAAMVIPFQSVMVPLVKVASEAQLLDSRLGLICIYVGFGQSFTVFLYHGFIKTVPYELEESALLDGCSDARLFFSIVFPLLKTITVTIIILQTLWVWNDFLLPSLILYAKDLQTIPLSINRFFGQYKNQWDKALPTLVMGILPIVVFFLSLQRFMIQGIAEGAVKG